MKKIRQHNDIDISVVIKNTEGEILDPSLCKGIQIRMQTNGNETQIAHYDIFEDGHIVFRFNAKDQTQIGVYDIVISATTTDGRVFTTDVCKAFCIVPCTCCTDNEPGEVETETLEVEATIEITSWGYMYDKRVEDIEDKLERLDNRDDKLQEQIDSNHTELGEAFEGLYDDMEKNYSKKSNTLRHITLSPSATANSLSLLLEGEYDDSVQGSHILGPHNIILPNATENNAGMMTSEDKKAILENKNTIETLGLITAQGFQGVDESIARLRKETNASIADTNKNLAKLNEDVAVEILGLQGQSDDNALAIEGKQDKLVSGENIKTINGQSVLGGGDIVIEGGAGVSGDYVTKEDVAKVEEMVKVNASDIVEINEVLNGVVDLDIADTIKWTNGYWHFESNQGVGSPYVQETYRYSNKIDISNYEEVKLSGLWNGGPSSTNSSRYPTITFFGDGEQIGWKDYPDGESFVVIRSDYKDYDKLEIVLNAYQSEETYVPSVKVTDVGGVIEDVRTLKKNVEFIGEDVSGLKASVSGLDDVDIADSLTWTKGCWNFTNNSGGGSSYMQETYRYSRIDVSNYDSVKLSGLRNGGPMSNAESRWPTVSIYGDNNPIKYIDIVDGDSYVLFTRDFKNYDKIEIIVMAYQSEDVYVPSIKVRKNSVFDGVFVPKRIVLCGDSLMGNESSLITLQLNSIAKAQGYEIVRHSMGGENIIGNLTRNGGVAIRVTSDFVMPTSGSVDIEVESAWMKSDGTYAQNPYNNATNREVRIMGVKGKMTRNSTTSYTFTRNEEGESFKVGVGTLLWDETLWSCRDYPHIWFTGQNMGYENEEDWADMINMATRNFGENFIVCSTALAGTTNKLVRCATKTFGDKYINLKAYTEGQAVYDGQRFGLIDSSALSSDYASLFWPGSDKVHQNNLLSYMWAVLMWNTMLDLDIVKGSRVENGEYYIQ